MSAGGDDLEAQAMRSAPRWGDDTAMGDIAASLAPSRHERWLDLGFALLVTILLAGWALLPAPGSTPHPAPIQASRPSPGDAPNRPPGAP